MAKKIAPTQGLAYGWERGEDFWGGPVNEDLLFIDTMIAPVVQSMSFSTPPADAVEGYAYLVAANPAGQWAGQAGKLAVLIEGAWTFYTPKEGWRVRVKSIEDFVWYDGKNWLSEKTGTNPSDPGSNPEVKPTAYDIAITVTDQMYADEALVHLPLLDALMLPANMGNASLAMLAASKAYFQLVLERNGTSVGTITVNTGSSSATFATIGGNAVRFAKGDVLTLRAPSVVVQSAKDFGLIIRLNFV